MLTDETANAKNIAPVLSPQRRQLMHIVMDGQTDLAGTMHILHGYRSCDTFLRWLMSNRYTGNTLKELIRVQFGGSVHRLAQYIVDQSKAKGSYASR